MKDKQEHSVLTAQIWSRLNGEYDNLPYFQSLFLFYSIFFFRLVCYFFFFFFFTCEFFNSSLLFYITGQMWNSIKCKRCDTKRIWYAWLALQMHIEAMDTIAMAETKTARWNKNLNTIRTASTYKHMQTCVRYDVYYTKPISSICGKHCEIRFKFWSNICRSICACTKPAKIAWDALALELPKCA